MMRTISAISVLLIVFTIMATNASALLVKIPDEEIAINESTDIPIEVKDAANLGSMDIVISYNPEIVRAEVVSKGELNKGLISSKIEDGIIAIGIADSNGINGDGEVAVITFEGLRKGVSNITIIGIRAYDVNTHADIRVETQNGKVTVVEKGKAPGFEVLIVLLAISFAVLRRRV